MAKIKKLSDKQKLAAAKAHNEAMAARIADDELPKLYSIMKEAISKVENTRKALKDYIVEHIHDICAIVSMRCPYMLHAILYVLKGVKHLKLLDKLPKKDLESLRDLIASVKDKPCPDPDKVEKASSLTGELTPDQKKLAEIRAINEAIMGDVWLWWQDEHDDMPSVLNRWEKAVQKAIKAKDKKAIKAKDKKAKQTPKAEQKTEPLEDKSEKYMSLEDLSKALGCKNKKAYLEKKSRLLKKLEESKELLEDVKKEKRAAVDSWFTMDVNPKTGKREQMFLAANLNKMKEFFGLPVEADIVLRSDVQEETPVSAKKQESPSATWLDFKAFEIMVKKLKELRDGAQSKQAEAKEQYDEALAKAQNADSRESTQLLQQAMDANTARAKYEDDVDKYQDVISNADAALEQRKYLEKEQKRLEDLFNQNNALVAALFKQAQELQVKA